MNGLIRKELLNYMVNTLKHDYQYHEIPLILKHLKINPTNFNDSDKFLDIETSRKFVLHLNHLVYQKPLEDLLSYSNLKCFYNYFPENIGCYLNCFNAKSAIENFIYYRCLMISFDQLIKYEDQAFTIIEYMPFHAEQDDYILALMNFNLLFDLIKYYVDEIKVSCYFSGYNIDDFTVKKLNKNFGTNCYFGQSSNKIVFYTRDLQQPFPLFNRRLFDLQKGSLDEKLSRDGIELEKFTKNVYTLINDFISSNYIDFSENSIHDIVCEKLCMSRWTLHRRLKKDNCSFTDLLKMVKLNRAKQLLSDPTCNLVDISEKLGFSSQSAFTRFFKNETNANPTNYRKYNTSIS